MTTGEYLASLSTISAGTAMEHLLHIQTGMNVPVINSLDIVTTSGVGINDGEITIVAGGGTPPYTYSIGNTYQSSNVFQNLLPNTYTISVKDFSGFTDTISGIKLSAPSAVAPIISEIIVIDASNLSTMDGSIRIIAAGGVQPYTYALNDGTYQTANIFTNLHAGVYSVSVKDVNDVVSRLSGVKISGSKVVVSTASGGGFGIGGGVNRYRPSIRVENVKLKDQESIEKPITVKVTL